MARAGPALVAVVLLASACATTGLLKTELFFGLSRPSGETISDGQWQDFVEKSVAPRFPAGFTVVDGVGHYLARDRVPVRERSKVLILVYPVAPHAEAAIEDIRAEYKRRFDQEEVLRITTETARPSRKP